MMKGDLNYHQGMERFEKNLVKSALAHAGGNRSEAARHLGIKRTTLTYRIKQLGLE
jgi:DNA-binding NtrC family response regulator